MGGWGGVGGGGVRVWGGGGVSTRVGGERGVSVCAHV